MRFAYKGIKELFAHIGRGSFNSLLISSSDASLSEHCVLQLAKFLESSIRRINYQDLEDLGLDQAFGNLSLFSKREIAKVTLPEAKLSAEFIKALENNQFACFPVFIIEDLSKGVSLRRQFELSPRLAALTCYEFEARGALISSLLKGYVLSADAKQYLTECLPAERFAMEMELEKLKCFCAHKTAIELEDIEHVVSGSSPHKVDSLFFALAFREAEKYFSASDALLDSGLAPILLLRSMLRYYLHLDTILSLPEPNKVEVAKLSPPIFFKYLSAFSEIIPTASKAIVKKALLVLYEAELMLKKADCSPQRAMEFIYLSLYESVSRHEII